MIGPHPHEAIDRENRERDARLAALIRRRPELVELAKSNLQSWIARWGKSTPAWQEWSQLLRMLTPAQVAGFLESTTPAANRLRQSSPFLGLLAEADRALAPKRHAA
jgi:hypothetical protein